MTLLWIAIAVVLAIAPAAGGILLLRQFVARSSFELSERECNRLRGYLADEKDRSRELMSTVLRLKHEGAILLPERTIKMARREPDMFEVALDQNPRTQIGSPARAHCRRWADREHEKGELTDQEIAERLALWATVTEDEEIEDTDVLEAVG